MKNYILAIFALLMLGTSLQSCKEDIELIGEFKETAVIYGILDQADSVHLIKITRAFIGPGNSLDFAQIPDSSYFDNVVATITEKVSGTIQRTWTLNDTTITNKDTDGIFYAPEQKLYVFNTPSGAPLLTNATYELHVNVNNGEFEVTGETKLVSGIYTNKDSPTTHLQFSKNTPPEFKNEIFKVYHTNAFRLNTTLEIAYYEFVGTDSTVKTFNWTLGERDVVPGSALSFESFTANGQTFYELVANSCSTSDPAVDKRNFKSITIKVVGAAEDLYNYILVNQPSSSLAQNKPTFTNLESTNDRTVIGVFSSRQTHEVKLDFIGTNQNIRCIDRKTTEQLCIGPITGAFLFCSQHSLDIAQTFPFACN
ncbi:MAG: hypothetical protein JKY09_04955 [Crocinitomicaceae bacterium]|nr:hypothetical protein [Crocinitomicaceae bacterium]